MAPMHRSFWFLALILPSLFSAGNSFGGETAPAQSTLEPSYIHPINTTTKGNTQTLVIRSLCYEADLKKTKVNK